MSTYSTLSQNRNSKKNIICILRSLQLKQSADFESYSTYYRISSEFFVEGVFTTTDLTKGSNKDSLTSNQWFYEGGFVYLDVSPGDIYLKNKIFLASESIILKESITSGDEVWFEPRLINIPFFNRKIDPIQNASIALGKFTLKVSNSDGKYNDMLNSSYFKGQVVEIYSIIDPQEIDESEILKLCTSTIQDVEANEKDITIKLNEESLLDRELEDNLEFVEGKTDEFYPYIFGSFKNLLVPSAEFDDYIYTGLNIDVTMGVINGATFEKAATAIYGEQLLATVLFMDTRIALGGLSSTRYSNLLKGKIIDIDEGGTTNFKFKTNLPIIAGLGTAEFKLFIHKDDYIALKDRVKLTNKWTGPTSDNPYISTNVSSKAFVGDFEISLDDNWSFLQEDDILRIRHDSFFFCEIPVDSYDASTNTVTLKYALPYDVSVTGLSQKIFFDNFQSVSINNDTHTRKFDHFNLFVGDISRLKSSGSGSYVTFQNENNEDYYIWFNIDSGNTDPDPFSDSGASGQEIPLTASDTQADIFSKILLLNKDFQTFGRQFTVLKSSDIYFLKFQHQNLRTKYIKPSAQVFDITAGGGLGDGWAVEGGGLAEIPAYSIDYNSSTKNIHIDLDRIKLSVNNEDGFLASYEGGLTIVAGSGSLKEQRKITTTGDKFKNLEEGSVIHLPDIDDIPFIVNEFINDNTVYLDRIVDSSVSPVSYTGNWHLYARYELVESSDIILNGIAGPGAPSYKNILVDLMENYYNLDTSQYDLTSLESIDTNFPYFNMGYILEDYKKLYQIVNELNKGTNFISYINRAGKIAFEYINFQALSASGSFYYSKSISFKNKMTHDISKSLIYKYAKDLSANEFDTITMSNSEITNIQTLLKLEQEDEIESKIMYNIFSESVSSVTYEDIIKDKYFSKFSEVEIIAGLEFLLYELGSEINLINFAGIPEDRVYILTDISTNGYQSKVKLIGII